MEDAPTATRLQLGQEIEGLRVRAGLNTTDAANLVGIKRGTFRRYELGETIMPRPHLELLLLKLGITDELETQRLLELQRQADQPAWWSEYNLEQFGRLLGFESIVKDLRVYEQAMVWGPLQTEEYARALIRGILGRDCQDEMVEKRVRLRLEQQQRTYKVDNPPDLRLVLDEAVVRRPIGGREVMAEQLRFLASVTGPCELRVLPFNAAAHPGLTGAFWIFEFDPTVRKPAVYFEGPRRSLYLDNERDVAQASVVFERLWEAAINPAASRELILSAVEELEQ